MDSPILDENETFKYNIAGVSVSFPYKPYAPQLAYMSQVMRTLENSKSGENANALLEAPTGSGKTLALLCSSLSWQSHFRNTQKAAEPFAPSADICNLQGGGFIQDSAGNAGNVKKWGSGGLVKKEKPLAQIIYATRTHGQISQVVRELRKTSYKAKISILAARKHYCTNRSVLRKKTSVDDECKLLLRDENKTCPMYMNVHKLISHPTLKRGALNSIHDIEDLVELGMKVKACAYFTARALAQDADIIFCPYNYILDPLIRRSTEVDVSGAILIFDEAHNIEDVAREAASITIELTSLDDLALELSQIVAFSPTQADIYQPLMEVVEELCGWLSKSSQSIQKESFERYSGVWTGNNILKELNAAGITVETFWILLDCCQKAMSATLDADPETQKLGGQAASVLNGLFMVLTYMLSDGARHINDFRMVVQRFVRRDEVSRTSQWVSTLDLWCLNPAVAFREVAISARSIIVTSGTLTPMASFASELATSFDVRMEGAHIVDVDRQVWARCFPQGPGDVALNASYKCSDAFAFQDTLGTALLKCCHVVPNGILVFFPSYSLLDKLCGRWQLSGLWDKLAAVKTLFIEPRGSDDKFEQMLAAYYKAVKGEEPQEVGRERKKSAKGAPKEKLDGAEKGKVKAESCNASPGGALLLAVCRGKVSEGIDFADANARAVIVVGIPFPNVKDLQVKLKKQYNSENRATRGLLSGDQWYCQQAFRALNQAIGRCIRHQHDYGAVLLFDERFQRSDNVEHVSKWLRKAMKPASSFEEALAELDSFFKDLQASPPGACSAAALAPSPIPSSPSPASKMYPIFKEVSLSRPSPDAKKASHAAADSLGSSSPRVPEAGRAENVLQPGACRIGRTPLPGRTDLDLELSESPFPPAAASMNQDMPSKPGRAGGESLVVLRDELEKTPTSKDEHLRSIPARQKLGVTASSQQVTSKCSSLPPPQVLDPPHAEGSRGLCQEPGRAPGPSRLAGPPESDANMISFDRDCSLLSRVSGTEQDKMSTAAQCRGEAVLTALNVTEEHSSITRPRMLSAQRARLQDDWPSAAATAGNGESGFVSPELPRTTPGSRQRTDSTTFFGSTHPLPQRISGRRQQSPEWNAGLGKRGAKALPHVAASSTREEQMLSSLGLTSMEDLLDAYSEEPEWTSDAPSLRGDASKAFQFPIPHRQQAAVHHRGMTLSSTSRCSLSFNSWGVALSADPLQPSQNFPGRSHNPEFSFSPASSNQHGVHHEGEAVDHVSLMEAPLKVERKAKELRQLPSAKYEADFAARDCQASTCPEAAAGAAQRWVADTASLRLKEESPSARVSYVPAGAGLSGQGCIHAERSLQKGGHENSSKGTAMRPGIAPPGVPAPPGGVDGGDDALDSCTCHGRLACVHCGTSVLRSKATGAGQGKVCKLLLCNKPVLSRIFDSLLKTLLGETPGGDPWHAPDPPDAPPPVAVLCAELHDIELPAGSTGPPRQMSASGSHYDVARWAEQDSCVYSMLQCPGGQHFIGVRVLATTADNDSLRGKALLFKPLTVNRCSSAGALSAPSPAPKAVLGDALPEVHEEADRKAGDRDVLCRLGGRLVDDNYIRILADQNRHIPALPLGPESDDRNHSRGDVSCASGKDSRKRLTQHDVASSERSKVSRVVAAPPAIQPA